MCGVLLSTVAGMLLGTVGGEMPWLGNCLLRLGSNSNCFYFMIPGHLQSASQHGGRFYRRYAGERDYLLVSYSARALSMAASMGWLVRAGRFRLYYPGVGQNP